MTLWMIFIIILCAVVYIANHVITSYYKAGVLWRYLCLVALIFFLFTAASVVWISDYEIHMHHYTIGMLAVSLLGF